MAGEEENEELTEQEEAARVAAEEAAEEAARKAEKAPKGKKTPAYLLDEPPDKDKKTDFIKWCLLHGKAEQELVAEGCNPGSVRVCAQQLEKAGLRQRPQEEPAPPKELSIPPGGPKSVQIFAKGSPPEALIESIRLPLLDGKDVGFERGLKFGATMIILGVRVAQELSNLGVQQARPIMDMAKSMREGEALAAKTAAGEAAAEAAGMVASQFGPVLANLAKPTGADPMKSMMVRVMEPMISRMMGTLIPGGGGPPVPQDWTKRTE